MASRSYSYTSASPNKGEVTICGAFSTNGGSSPVNFRGPTGLGTTLPNGVSAITRTGTGTYTITFQDNFFAQIYAGVDLSMGTPANNFAQYNGPPAGLNTTGSLVATITTFVGGAAGDIAAASGNEVTFCFVFKNSASV